MLRKRASGFDRGQQDKGNWPLALLASMPISMPQFSAQTVSVKCYTRLYCSFLPNVMTIADIKTWLELPKRNFKDKRIDNLSFVRTKPYMDS